MKKSSCFLSIIFLLGPFLFSLSSASYQNKLSTCNPQESELDDREVIELLDDDFVMISDRIPSSPIKDAMIEEVKVEVLNPYANVTGRYGMKNHSNICYMNSIITSLFGINRFTETLFSVKPTTATAVMLSEVFYKLQQGKGSVSTNLSLMPAVSKEMQWAFGGFHCVLEFLLLFLCLMPTEFNDLFTVKGHMNFIRKSDGARLKYLETTDLVLTVHLKYKSLAETLAVEFRDVEAEDYLIDPHEWEEYSEVIPVRPKERIKIPIFNTTRIINRPEILIFGIDRTVVGFGNMYAKTDSFVLDSTITLPPLSELEDERNNKYILQAFCAHSPGHYVSFVRDFRREGSFLDDDDNGGDWYKYNDANVSAMTTAQDYKTLREAADKHATLAFYVRSDVVARSDSPIPEAPERIKKISKLMMALEEVQGHAEAVKENEKAKAMRPSNPISISEYFSSSSHVGKQFVSENVTDFISTASASSSSIDVDDYKKFFPRSHHYNY